MGSPKQVHVICSWDFARSAIVILAMCLNLLRFQHKIFGEISKKELEGPHQELYS